MLQGHTRPITTVKYNADGDLLFSTAKDNTPTVWYAETGERLGTYGNFFCMFMLFVLILLQSTMLVLFGILIQAGIQLMLLLHVLMPMLVYSKLLLENILQECLTKGKSIVI